MSGPMRLSGVEGQPIKVSVEFARCRRRPWKRSPGLALHPSSSFAMMARTPCDVVVLSGTQVRRVDRRTVRMGPWMLHSRDQKDGNILVETIHSFKGQDSPIVHPRRPRVTYRYAPTRGDRAAETTLYVGMSRARSLLILLRGTRSDPATAPTVGTGAILGSVVGSSARYELVRRSRIADRAASTSNGMARSLADATPSCPWTRNRVPPPPVDAG